MQQPDISSTDSNGIRAVAFGERCKVSGKYLGYIVLSDPVYFLPLLVHL